MNESEYDKNLYIRLRRLLCGSGLSVRNISNILNVSEDVVEAWINGSRYPMPKYLGYIANMCNVSVEYLLCRTDNSEKITHEEIKCRFYGKNYRPYIQNNMIDLSAFSKDETEKIVEFCDKIKNGGDL